MTETQNDEDDTMTSDHDVTTVSKDVKKWLNSELERVDSVYNSDEEPSGTDDEEEFERNETKTEHYGGLGPESQEADEEVFDYKVQPPPYGWTVPILQYNEVITWLGISRSLLMIRFKPPMLAREEQLWEVVERTLMMLFLMSRKPRTLRSLQRIACHLRC